MKEYVVFLNVPRGHKTGGWKLDFLVEAESKEKVAELLGLTLCPGSKVSYQLPPELAHVGTPYVSIWEIEEISSKGDFIVAVEKAAKEVA